MTHILGDDMKTLIIAVASSIFISALNQPALTQSSGHSNGLKLAMFEYDKTPGNRFDDACAMLAATIVAGYSGDASIPKWATDCSQHPKNETCVATRKFILDNKKALPAELVCGQAH